MAIGYIQVACLHRQHQRYSACIGVWQKRCHSRSQPDLGWMADVHRRTHDLLPHFHQQLKLTMHYLLLFLQGLHGKHFAASFLHRCKTLLRFITMSSGCRALRSVHDTMQNTMQDAAEHEL